MGILLLFFSFYVSNAQTGFLKKKFKNNISFDIKLNASRFSPAQLKSIGENWLQNKAALGGYFGAGISVNTGNLLISSGAEYGFYNSAYKFDFFANDKNARVINYSARYFASDFQKSVYLNFKYVFNAKGQQKKFTPILGLGIKYNRVPSGFITIDYGIAHSGDSARVNFSYTETVPNANTNLFAYFSYQVSIGVLEISKRKNLVQLNLVYNISPTTIYKAEYEFDVFEKESFGTTTFNGDYIGLEFIFGLKPWKR